MNSWDHSGFSVGWKERRIEADDRKNLEGLLSYMERPAVSLRRLRYRDDSMVHYQGTRFHPRLGIDIDPIIDDELYVVDPVPQEEDDAPA